MSKLEISFKDVPENPTWNQRKRILIGEYEGKRTKNTYKISIQSPNSDRFVIWADFQDTHAGYYDICTPTPDSNPRSFLKLPRASINLPLFFPEVRVFDAYKDDGLGSVLLEIMITFFKTKRCIHVGGFSEEGKERIFPQLIEKYGYTLAQVDLQKVPDRLQRYSSWVYKMYDADLLISQASIVRE